MNVRSDGQLEFRSFIGLLICVWESGFRTLLTGFEGFGWRDFGLARCRMLQKVAAASVDVVALPGAWVGGLEHRQHWAVEMSCLVKASSSLTTILEEFTPHLPRTRPKFRRAPPCLLWDCRVWG